MALILTNVWNGINYLFEDNGDERTRDFLFVKTPTSVLTIIGCYLYFCLNLGPRLMRDRKPYDLKNVLIVYNALQVLYSIYLVYLGSFAYINNYKLICQPLDNSTDPIALKIAEGFWFYFFAKITELLDTVFFVLRKKDSQVTFLHVYHHAIMPVVTWGGVKYFPSGNAALMGWLNSMVHVFMYSYYLLAGLGPEYQKYLWWKKHITTMQLVQFAILFVHYLTALLTDCSYPKAINGLILFNSTLFLYLFGKFYVNSYMRNKNMSDKKKIVNGLNGIIKNGSTNRVNGYESKNRKLDCLTKTADIISKIE